MENSHTNDFTCQVFSIPVCAQNVEISIVKSLFSAIQMQTKFLTFIYIVADVIMNGTKKLF